MTPFEVAESNALGKALLVESAIDASSKVLENSCVHLLNALPPLAAAAHIAVLDNGCSFNVPCLCHGNMFHVKLS